MTVSTQTLLKRSRLAASSLLAASLLACSGGSTIDPQAVLAGYRTLAHAGYTDAYKAAEALQAAIAKLDASPSPATLAAAREAWRAARRPYSRTEALRFGNWFVDDWETRVNAWPIDEGFIDYVADGYVASPTNPEARLNLIAADRVTIGGQNLNTEPMRRIVLEQAQASSNIEANVATGYHAIEFMLWGQDLYGTQPGAGERPWTDFAHDAETCTDGPAAGPLRHCERRRAFLRELVELLRRDLLDMAGKWGPQSGSFGDRLVEGDPKVGLRRMLFGLATMSGDELAGERMQVALLANAPEDEQDCFSDDTHNSLLGNALGVEAFYFGRMGAQDMPASLADLAQQTDAELAKALELAFARTRRAMQAIADAGDNGRPFDTLIAPGNDEGAALIQAGITALRAQTRLLEQLGDALELGGLNPNAQIN